MPGENVKLIVTNAALRDWEGTLRYALTSGGAAYKLAMTRYPTQNPGSTYQRTHVLGKTAEVSITGTTEATLTAAHHGTYVLFPPKVEFIVPKEKAVLAWQGKDGAWHHAAKVRRVWWPGQLEKVRAAFVKGFVGGLKKAVSEGRRL